MPQIPIRPSLVIAAAALAGALGLQGCHPRKQGTLPRTPAESAAAAPPAASAEGKPPCGCAVKVREPDQVTTTQERVLVAPAGSRDKVIPALTRVVEKTVVVKPAWTQTLQTPAVYKTVWRTETTPGRTYAVATPARYRTVSERVLVEPEHTVWKPGRGRPVSGPAAPGYAAYAPTGEVMCAVVVPARYEVRTRRVLVSAPSERLVQGAPVTRRVSERVLVSPAGTRVIEHPAVTKSVRAAEVVTPAQTISVRTPPVYTLVAKTVRTPRYGWKPVPCAKPRRAPAPKPHPTPRPRPHVEERPYALPIPHGAPYGERG